MDEPPAADLLAELLAGDAASQMALLRSAAPADLARLVPALGRERSQAAARALALVDAGIDDRAARKAARRELHRLRASGVPAPDIADVAQMAGPVVAPATRRREVVAQEAWATAIGGDGSRRLWLLGDRALGGAWLADLVLDDIAGLAEAELIETTRKRVLRELDQLRRDPLWGWVPLPVPYAMQLVGESLALTRELGHPVPTRYDRLVELFGEPPGAPDRPLIFDTVGPLAIRLHPEWLKQADALLDEPQLLGWPPAASAELAARALAVAGSRYATLVVPGGSPEQQAAKLLGDATRELVTPQLRRALRRRLEEMAYVFEVTDRPLAARRAVAAAFDLTDAAQPAEANPLVRALVVAGLVRAVADEQVAGQPAGQILFELLEAADEDDDSGPPLTTTPTGLILPR